MNEKEILKVKNLTKEFSNKTGVFDVNFGIPKGKITGFIGDNGAGKTTTIKLILGVFKKDKGEILFDNHNITTKDLKKIAFFPDQNNYPKNFNIVEYAKYNASLKNISRKEYEPLLNKMIDDLGLSEFTKSKFTDLSAGQQKRALLLATLITKPEMIILDEPTANLDVKSRLEFLNLLSQLAKIHNITIFITSHNIDELEKIINHVVIIESGMVMYKDDFDLKNGSLRKIYEKYANQKQAIKSDSILKDWDLGGKTNEK